MPTDAARSFGRNRYRIMRNKRNSAITPVSQRSMKSGSRAIWVASGQSGLGA